MMPLAMSMPDPGWEARMHNQMVHWHRANGRKPGDIEFGLQLNGNGYRVLTQDDFTLWDEPQRGAETIPAPSGG